MAIVGDASVWINLAATGEAHRVLRAFGEPALITDIAKSELDRGRPKGRRAADEVAALVHMELVQVVPLESEDETLFMNLVSGPAAETLDDGEAATLAIAHRIRGTAVIDERKATALCERRFPSMTLRSTTDIFLADVVRHAFGDDALGDALFLALTEARMRVPDRHVDEVVRLVGPIRISQCTSLPEVARNGARRLGLRPGS